MIYQIGKRIYHFIMKLWGTQIDEFRWSRKKPEDRCWDFHPHRDFLIEKIVGFEPTSVLEVGCGTGTNLYLLSQRLPEAKLWGVDINPRFVEKGNECLRENGIENVKLFQGKAEKLNFLDRGFDVVVSDAFLIYVGRNKIMKVLREMVRVARSGLVLHEWHSLFDVGANVYGEFNRHWRRHYTVLFKKIVPNSEIHIYNLPRDVWWNDVMWSKYGRIIVVKL